jgi:hypothetical protein
MRKIAKEFFLLSAATAFAVAASPALAAVVAGGPPIAYALNSGNTFTVTLSNPDGTGKASVYTSANKTYIAQVDIRPGGNELAILESSVAGGQGVLKIVRYSNAGVRTGLTTVDSGNCQNLGVDYHPTDGSLLVSRYCNNAAIQEVRVYHPAANSWDSDPLVQVTNGNPDKSAGMVRWLGDGSGFLWVVSDTSVGGRIDRHMLSNPYAPVTVYSTGRADQPNWFDVAHCTGALDSSCEKMLVTDISGQIHLVAFDDFGGSDHGVLYSNAADGHYSPDNAHVLWRLQVKGGYQLKIDNGVFVSKGTFGGKDWRQ